MDVIRRGFVTVGSRQLHYRRVGTGPAALLIHPALGSGRAMLPLMQELSAGRTVFALDVPGFGESDSLPISQPSIEDYAAACVGFLDAAGLRRIGLYGKENGAKIALAVARKAPERVRSLVLDGLALHDEAETADLVENYAIALDPQWDGSHMLRAWTICRDTHLFFPWYSRRSSNRLIKDMPAPDVLHDDVVDILLAGTGYARAALAGLRYDPVPALVELRVPTTIVFSSDDPFVSHRLRLPALPDGVQTETVPPGLARLAAVADILRAARMEGEPDTSPTDIRCGSMPEGLTRDFVQTPQGQVHVRRGGAGGTPLLLFHASPGSCVSLKPLAEALAPTRRVMGVDTFGYGDSDRPTWENPVLADFAQVMADVIKACGWSQVDVFGSHSGAAIALELASIAPNVVRNLILHDLPLFSLDEREDLLEHHLPSFPPLWDGSHLVQLWNYARNRSLFWPWHKQDAGHALKRDVSVPEIQRFLLDLLKAGASYSTAYRAVFEYPSQERLRALRVRTLVTTRAGGPMEEYLVRAAAIRQDIQTDRVPGYAPASALAQTAARYASFFDRA